MMIDQKLAETRRNIQSEKRENEIYYQSAEERTYEILAIVSEGLVRRYFVKMSCRAGLEDQDQTVFRNYFDFRGEQP